MRCFRGWRLSPRLSGHRRQTPTGLDLSRRLPAQFARYEKLGVSYADSAFAVRISATPRDGSDGIGPDASAPVDVRVTLSNQLGMGEIRYTLDGSVPSGHSPHYTAPLDLKAPLIVTAATFERGQPVSRPRRKRSEPRLPLDSQQR